MIEYKKLFVGGKVIVMRTEGEFDAFEALVVKLSVTRKSAVVIRLEHADQALKEHGASWINAVSQEEDNNDLVRAKVEEMYEPTGDVAKFIQEFKSLGEARKEITKKMEALANQYSFHISGENVRKAKEAKEKAGAAKAGKKGQGKKAVPETAAVEK